ncbi:MAG TPA: APC family permease [Bryobacteraceae bacterium]|nr:APC family permease [Bryobacteraceae bacterium]HPU71046.1 APC family permease [Bryobacteraceae bacterium]
MHEPQPALPRVLGLRDLVLFNIAAVVGIRWLAAAAHAGPGSLTLWVLAAVFFFVPSAVAVSSLTSKFPEQGGIYVWTRRSFGDWHGFLCGWCYWLSNLFYFPNLLLAGIGMALYAFGERYIALADNRGFVTAASLAVLWVALLTNLFGLRIGRWTENVGGLATYAAGLTLVVLGMTVWASHGAATQLTLAPEWNWDRINFWSQIAFAFGGLELGAIMGGEIRDPARTVPRAAWISGLAIAGFYILGTLAILVVLPPDRVNILTGLTQAGAAAAGRLSIPSLAPLLAVLITAGITGQLGAWLSGSARVPFAIGLDRYLPPAFGRVHPRWRTPHVAILTQGAACTVFLLGMLAGESLRTGYQLLVDMTVITYFIPFLYLFAAAIRHGMRAGAVSGLVVTVAAIAFSLVPPAGVESVWLFEAKLLGGCLLLIGAARIAFYRGKRLRE